MPTFYCHISEFLPVETIILFTFNYDFIFQLLILAYILILRSWNDKNMCLF